MRVLVTGGAGYIGSHMVYGLLDSGIEVHVIDNLSNGNFKVLPKKTNFTRCDIQDFTIVDQILASNKFDAVIHFAASISVPESVDNPIKYYNNNISKTITLLECCVKNNIKNFLFSSTAAVYGKPESNLISENHTKIPLSPYGYSKLVVENILESISLASGMNVGILRYFNVSAADPQMRTGQITENATHLIKVACETALGQRPYMEIFGNNYNTHDGSAIRDYIHISDLINAHILLLKKLIYDDKNHTYNCGYGKGYSVFEIVDAVKRLSKNDFKTIISKKRKGDPEILISDNSLLKNKLLWEPKFDNIDVIIKHTLDWEKISKKLYL